MTIKPLGNRLVVELIKQKTTTASGIILTAEEKTEQALGKIIDIGKGQGTDENITNLDLKIGDTVLFGKYAGEEVKDNKINDNTFKILKGSDVLAIIQD
jgi:chaperonin GroES